MIDGWMDGRLNELIDGRYDCVDRKFPPCKSGKRHSSRHVRFHFQLLTCDECSQGSRKPNLRKCTECGENKDNACFRQKDNRHYHLKCMVCEEKKNTKRKCTECGEDKDIECFKQKGSRHNHPKCMTCEETGVKAARSRECQTCRQTKPKRFFEQSANGAYQKDFKTCDKKAHR